MLYVKGMITGLATVLFGCLFAPFALIIWAIWKSPAGGTTVSFSPMGLANHLAHSPGFWVFIIVLFSAGFLPSIFLLKR